MKRIITIKLEDSIEKIKKITELFEAIDSFIKDDFYSIEIMKHCEKMIWVNPHYCPSCKRYWISEPNYFNSDYILLCGVCSNNDIQAFNNRGAIEKI